MLDRTPQPVRFASDQAYSCYRSLSQAPCFQLRLARHWSDLTHLRLARIRLLPPPDSPLRLPALTALTALAHLRSVHIDDFDTEHVRGAALYSLPTTVATLNLNDYGVYTNPAFATILRTDLARRGTSLRELALLDDNLKGDRGSLQGVVRGVYGSVLPSLTNLRLLAISPCAVADLATSLAPLAPLKNLAELTLQQGFGIVELRLEPVELQLYLEASPVGLREVRVSDGVSEGWGARRKVALEEVARRKGVQARWCDVSM